MQRSLLLPASAALAAVAVLAVLAAVRAQGRAADRAAAARERERALIVTVDKLTAASSQKPVLHAVR